MLRLIVYTGPYVRPSYTVWNGTELLRVFKTRSAALGFMARQGA